MYNQFEPKIVGNTISMTTTFTDALGVSVIPDTVTVKYKKPDGVIVTLPVVPVSDKYIATVLLDAPGQWVFRWECTGVHASAEEFSVNVRDTLVK